MLLTKEQISEQMCKHAQKKNGLHDLMEIMLESMRTAMPNEESVLTLMGSVAMEHKAYDRILPNITCDIQLFPE